MAGFNATLQIRTFYRSSTVCAASDSTVVQEKALNARPLCERMAALHPVLQKSLQEQREAHRRARGVGKGGGATREKMTNFTVGDFVLLARE